MKAELVVTEGADSGTNYALAEGTEYVFGRSSKVNCQLADLKTSRRHCKVTLRGTVCTVDDLGSSNGTRVNGQKITVAKLQPGDQIRIGRTVLEYRVEGAAAKAPPPPAPPPPPPPPPPPAAEDIPLAPEGEDEALAVVPIDEPEEELAPVNVIPEAPPMVKPAPATGDPLDVPLLTEEPADVIPIDEPEEELAPVSLVSEDIPLVGPVPATGEALDVIPLSDESSDVIPLDEEEELAPSHVAGASCRKCGASLQPGTVLCVQCGTNQKSGARKSAAIPAIPANLPIAAEPTHHQRKLSPVSMRDFFAAFTNIDVISEAFGLTLSAVIWGIGFLAVCFFCIFISFIPLLPFFVIFIYCAYVASYFVTAHLNICRAAAFEEILPEKPERSLTGLGYAFGIGALSLGPFVLFGVILAAFDVQDFAKWNAAAWLCALWAFSYGPMAAACVAIDRSGDGLNPLRVLTSIVLTMPEYLLVVVLCAIATAIIAVVRALLLGLALGSLPAAVAVMVTLLPGTVLAQYLYAFIMWELGLLCRRKRDKLSWMQ